VFLKLIGTAAMLNAERAMGGRRRHGVEGASVCIAWCSINIGNCQMADDQSMIGGMPASSALLRRARYINHFTRPARKHRNGEIGDRFCVHRSPRVWYGSAMTISIQECREHAWRCEQKAMAAADAKARAVLFEAARNWATLAETIARRPHDEAASIHDFR
jgi:hypothetical protein